MASEECLVADGLNQNFSRSGPKGYSMNNRVVKRHDPLTPRQRSAQMAKVRAKRNRSTEMRVAAYLIRYSFRGWKRHINLPGRPDFCFVRKRLAVFVDGCFWHG